MEWISIGVGILGIVVTAGIAVYQINKSTKELNEATTRLSGEVAEIERLSGIVLRSLSNSGLAELNTDSETGKVKGINVTAFTDWESTLRSNNRLERLEAMLRLLLARAALPGESEQN